MLRPDAREDSSMAYDPDPAGVNCTDNLSISLESFNKILDEDPDPRQSHPTGTPSGLHQCKLAPGQVNFVNVFQHQSEDWLGLLESEPVMEELRELGSSQWDSSNFTEPSDCKKEICLELLFGSEGTSNNLSDIYHTSRIDNGNLHALQHTDSNKFSSLPPNHSPDWLRLSSSIDNTCLMDSVEGSFDGLNSSNFYHQQLQNNMLKCNTSPESAEGAHFYTPYTDIVNGLYLDSGQEKDFVQRGGEISFQMGVNESILDVDNNSALLMRQNGGIDSSHIFLMEKSDLSDRMKLNMNTTSVLDSTAQERNQCAALSMSPSMDPDTMLPDTIHAEVNTSKATDIVCNGAESCFTLLRDSATDAEIASMQIFPGQFFQPFLSPEKEAMIYRMNEGDNPQLLIPNTCMINEAKLRTQEESLDNSVPEDSVIDSESFSIDLLCAERKHCEDTNSNSESSTDSSPVLSTRNSTSDDIDKSMVNTAKPLVPNSNIIFPNKKQKTLSKDKREDQIPASRHKHNDVPKGGYAAVQRNPLRSSLSGDDDEDICVLDDISDPVRSSSPSVHMKLHPMSHRSGFSDPRYHGPGDMRLNAYDERLTLRTALQDLSQPKSEANPPDGVLAVPLLRHQRIALSWMVQKEKNSLHCSGGILADDQGLGKTISTIALILMERSPSSRYCSMTEKPDKLEALNLDDDDDVSGVNVVKQPPDSSSVLTNSPIKRENSVMVVKGRPAAGTLVVCPTSVLRQWGDELQSKVTSKANLSFLVYHGSNRTKDPNELAKYDVVLTTYAIVSMEVPKQPLVDKDDEETRTADVSGIPSGLLNSKKRKKSPSLSTKNQTNRTKVDSTLLESAARPLARVGWFRVILDEAQSIKNHRTQVARACWGLRAKRRWCLSGTPIQNAIDDLYSYFRFLRYDPYAVYKSFCTSIKGPISRNPTHGYKKLQLVLKTIMLRRTKGTQIDGKPIITLPPKTITLKKVEFSKEERAFYSTLEDESREQFMEYAAAGTVKQNYVNILLMLLRLRQACDHPLLVRGYDSNSTGSSSMEMAKKFPRDKQINLLSCLEACLAICTICNDPPEDAVVTICGHVFCKQCICEHLTGDDNVCPSANCKVRLSVASVFSRGTLKSCLSGLPDHHSSSGSSVPCLVNTCKTEDSVSSDSSKINAALEILQSLPRSQCSSLQIDLEKSNGGCTGFLENAVNTAPAKRSMDLVICDSKYADSEKSSNARATEKAIVFSQWTRMLDLLEIPLKDSCIQYRRLDGTMSVASRDKAVKDFNTLPEITVMIMSLKAASLGLNMVAASHVVLLDLWWNPTTEDQAIDRAHRIGQTRPVTVSRLTVKDTVEDRILALQQKKREMVSSAFGEDESGSRQTRLTVDDLKYLFMA